MRLWRWSYRLFVVPSALKYSCDRGHKLAESCTLCVLWGCWRRIARTPSNFVNILYSVNMCIDICLLCVLWCGCLIMARDMFCCDIEKLLSNEGVLSCCKIKNMLQYNPDFQNVADWRLCFQKPNISGFLFCYLIVVVVNNVLCKIINKLKKHKLCLV